MPAVVTSPGRIEVWRGRTRVWAGAPPADLLAAFAALVNAKADRNAAFTVRLTAYPTVKYSKPVVGTINLGGELPE